MSTVVSDPLIEAQRRYIHLRKVKDGLEEQAKKISDQMAEMEPVLCEQMAAIGQSHTILDGVRLQVRTTPRISKRGEVTMERLCEVFRAMPEFAWLVKPGVHAQQMQAALKEVIEEHGSLPAEIEPLVRVYEQTQLAMTKA